MTTTKKPHGEEYTNGEASAPAADAAKAQPVKYQLSPGEKKAERITEVSINGVKVGELAPVDFDRGRIEIHSKFNVKGLRSGLSGLAQGFGETPEQAISDAFVESRRQSVLYLSSLGDLEFRLGLVTEAEIFNRLISAAEDAVNFLRNDIQGRAQDVYLTGDVEAAKQALADVEKLAELFSDWAGDMDQLATEIDDAGASCGAWGDDEDEDL